ncbi:macro domain-containing protein [candidate division KSB1 bacterium]|nr:macro domain-containing protein [candidate division KSB1 bacterium]
MQYQINNTTIAFVNGDITEMDTDAIVNAANAQLILGGGVAGAIRKKGGPAIQAECKEIGGTIVGGAVMTGGGSLKARYVIHAVGPRNGEGDEELKLQNATENSLKSADGHKLHSIAFPAISAGIFGFPVDRCADVMITTTLQYVKNNSTNLNRIIFCLYDDDTLDVFESAAGRLIGD